MPSILFWNLNQRPLQQRIKALVDEYHVDILILAESCYSTASIVSALNTPYSGFEIANTQCAKLQFYCKFKSSFFTPRWETNRISIRKLEMPGRNPILLASAHLPSRLRLEEFDISEECRFLAKQIVEIEDEEKHQRTILMGDLNLDPFADGMITADGLHAVMSRKVALKVSRVIQSRSYRFFYNPMWSHLGDRVSDAAGTFFYSKAQHKSYFWHTFDQILIRPALIKKFKHDQVRVIDRIGSQSLLTKRGRPDTSVGSDHLPIYLSVDF